MARPKHKAWTGGYAATSFEELGQEAYEYALLLYRDQIREYEDYWGKHPDHDTSQVFYRRAFLDAYATYHQQ